MLCQKLFILLIFFFVFRTHFTHEIELSNKPNFTTPTVSLHLSIYMYSLSEDTSVHFKIIDNIMQVTTKIKDVFRILTPPGFFQFFGILITYIPE